MPEEDGRLWQIGEEIIGRLDSINSFRERALAESRRVVRLSANATRAVHRNEFDTAIELLDDARAMRDSLENDLRDFPNLYWTGYVQDAQKEYAEARITLGIISRRGIPTPQDLNVEDAVFLNGLGEAAGELRRYSLDSMRRHDLARASELLSVMDEIYDLLVSVDYPDAVTGGLRRTTDMVRGVLERTRGDLTQALRQRELTDALSHAEDVLRVNQESSGS
ncbi:MAG: haloacid dehalogenase [Nitrolancea sp.]